MNKEKNVLIIASAGAGKTTFLVREALLSSGPKRTLILTYTESNHAEIIRKFYEEKKPVPSNIIVQTWFSFLLEHLVRPYQSVVCNYEIKGMQLVNKPSGVKYIGKRYHEYYGEDEDFFKHYFNNKHQVYSDKLSKLALRCMEKSRGAVLNRLTKIFENIYVDEVQDLAGYDLDIIKEFFKSKINIKLVGDPRQVTYLTHIERKYDKYSDGKIAEFVYEKCKSLRVKVDYETLKVTHRNHQEIADFASKLYPNLSKPTSCSCCRNKQDENDEFGVYLVAKNKSLNFLDAFKAVQLRWDKRNKDINPNYQALNFGVSKGLGFDNVLIYPTLDMEKWVLNHSDVMKSNSPKAKLYVAITRARHRVGIVISDDKLKKYKGCLKIY